MPFITQGKTNYIPILIVSVFAIFVGMAIFNMLSNLNSDLTSILLAPEVKRPENIQNVTAGWKIYQNEEYGFLFQYPEEYDNIENCKIIEGKLSKLQMGQITIEVLDVDKFIYYLQNTLKEYSSESILIDKKQGIKVNYVWGGIKDTFVFFIEKNKIYKISLYGGTSCLEIGQKRSDVPSDSGTFKKILSTFKFYKPQKEFIRVISPNGGENLKIGETYNVTWNSRGIEDNVKIYLEEKINKKRIEIGNASNTGSFDWTIDKVFDDAYKLVVEGVSSGNQTKIEDESNDYFYITPSLVSNTYFMWTEDGIEYRLRKISLGEITAPNNLAKNSGGYYDPGEIVYALTLSLWIDISPDFKGECVPMNFRRIINEKGDTVNPNTKQYLFLDTGGCIGQTNMTHTDQKVIFVVQKSEKSFNITTGGKSNTFFDITNKNGQLIVEKACLTETCGRISSLMPDLIIKSVGLAPQNPKVGDNLKFSITVKNIGTEFSGETSIMARIQKGSWGNSGTVPILLPGEEKTITFELPTQGIKELSNPYVFDITVDLSDNIKELNEKNNTQIKTINISLP